MQLKKTDTGIYYLYDYIPKRNFAYCSEKEIAITRKIWEYKNGNMEALNFFTNELMLAVAVLANEIHSQKMGLVAVPPSKVNKASTMHKSIRNMVNWYEKGITKTHFNTQKAFYDYSTLLTRVTDISTAHEGKRASYDEQAESIVCNRDNLSRLWTTFFILDDVTTKGTSMDVCKDILLEHGAKEQYIVRLAIARTV